MLDPQRAVADGGAKLQTVKSPLSTSGLTPTSFKDITSYNNFYEFGVEKDEPVEECRAHEDPPLDGDDRRSGEGKEKGRYRRAVELQADRGEGLSPSLRGGLEHGDSVGRLFPLGIDQMG